MRLSPTTGKGLMGQGSGVISIDGVQPASLSAYTGGGWGWLSDTVCAGQAFTAGLWHLKQLTLPNTLADLTADTSAGDLAQQFRAGNSVWARFVAGGGVHTAAAIGLTLPLAALGDMDSTGRMAVIQNYAGDNGIVTYNAIGATLTTISTTVLAGTVRMRMGSGVVANQNGQQAWHLYDVVTGALSSFAPRTDTVISNVVPVTISGQMWVVEVSSTDISLRPATSSNGYVIATSPNIFFPDAVSLSAGTVRIGYSTTTGEGPTHLRLADVTVGTGGLTTGTTASGPLVLTPQSPMTPSPMPVGPVEGGSLTSIKQPRYAIKSEAFIGGEDGKRVYQKYWDIIAAQAFSNVNLTQAIGDVSPAQGGTGTTTGLSVLDGQALLPDTTPLDTPQTFGPFVLATGRNLVLTTPLTIDTYVTLNGTANLRIV